MYFIGKKKGTSESEIDRNVGADASRVRSLLQRLVPDRGLVESRLGRELARIRPARHQQRVDPLQRHRELHHLSGGRATRSPLRQDSLPRRQDQSNAQPVV